MSQVINTNIMSLTAQRNLNSSQSSLATAMQRLSSGLRINSAKDDAAGLAISTRMTTQINGLNTAVRNANDGISLAQTTESALAQVTDNLQRIRELAVQSANGTNSADDRAALNNEVLQRVAEINRIATQTSFNGLHVLDGSAGVTKFQVGANVGQTIGIDLSQGVKADQMGVYTKTSASATGTVDVSGGLTLSAATTITVGSKTATVAAGTYTQDTLGTALNSAFAKAGITTAVADTSSGFVVINSRLGADDASGAADIGGNTDFGITATAAAANTSAALSSVDVSTANGANDAIGSVDAALASVSSLRSTLGAVQNRFESTISNLQTISENLSASRSRIQDTDFAAETAAMSRAQILQQAGVSMLAQANAQPQTVLKLLQ